MPRSAYSQSHELHEKKKGCPRGSGVSTLRLIFYMYVAHHGLAVA